MDSWGHYLDQILFAVLPYVAVFTLVYGCLAAFRQRDPRGVVAYSSLAQMGLILLGLSTYLGSGGTQGLGGAYLQTINHALVSAGLFLLIGIIEVRTGERDRSWSLLAHTGSTGPDRDDGHSG